MASTRAQEAITVRVFLQRLSTTRRGARLARTPTARQLDSWGVPYGSEASDAACPVVAEPAANTVPHGRVRGRDFALRLAYDEGSVRIEVSDTHSALPARTPDGAGADGERGRGPLLVEAVAPRWGVSGRSGPGTPVWPYVRCGRMSRPRLGATAVPAVRPGSAGRPAGDRAGGPPARACSARPSRGPRR